MVWSSESGAVSWPDPDDKKQITPARGTMEAILIFMFSFPSV
jgi:hypothetical protein